MKSGKKRESRVKLKDVLPNHGHGKEWATLNPKFTVLLWKCSKLMPNHFLWGRRPETGWLTTEPEQGQRFFFFWISFFSSDQTFFCCFSCHKKKKRKKTDCIIYSADKYVCLLFLMCVIRGFNLVTLVYYVTTDCIFIYFFHLP